MPKLQHQGFWSTGGDIPEGANITPIRYTSEYIVATYYFDTGADLDTRTKLMTPNIGDYMGWGRASSISGPLQTTILKWGGDNTGTGLESVYFDVANFKLNYPDTTDIVMDFRCFWYGTVGTTPIKLNIVLYKGGQIAQSGFGFTNPTAIESKNVSSASKSITQYNRLASDNGTGLARLKYNVYSGVGYLDTSLT